MCKMCEGKYKCPEKDCPFSFPTLGDLRMHMSNHYGEND